MSHGVSGIGSGEVAAGGVVVGNYLVQQTLGQGTFGKVKLGVHLTTKEKVAVKILEKARIKEVADAQRVAREIKILKRLRHPNVIQLFEVIDTPKQILLVMEHLDSGELFDYIVRHTRIREDVAARFFHDVVDGLAYLHRKEVAHRDLKPENILMSRREGGGYRLKIIDFGLSNTFDGGKLLKTACGSPCYAAPELLTHQPYRGEVADVWSLGVVLFAMVCGYLPYEDANTAKLYDKILRADYKPPRWISNAVRDLVGHMFCTDPSRRYTIADIRRHPWYTQIMVPSSPLKTTPASTGDLLEAVVAECVRLGVDRATLTDALLRNAHNNVTATYFLLAERMARAGGEVSAATGAGRVGGGGDAPLPPTAAPFAVGATTAAGGTGTPAPGTSSSSAPTATPAAGVGGAMELAAPSPIPVGSATHDRPRSARGFNIAKLGIHPTAAAVQPTTSTAARGGGVGLPSPPTATPAFTGFISTPKSTAAPSSLPVTTTAATSTMGWSSSSPPSSGVVEAASGARASSSPRTSVTAAAPPPRASGSNGGKGDSETRPAAATAPSPAPSPASVVPGILPHGVAVALMPKPTAVIIAPPSTAPLPTPKTSPGPQAAHATAIITQKLADATPASPPHAMKPPLSPAMSLQAAGGGGSRGPVSPWSSDAPAPADMTRPAGSSAVTEAPVSLAPYLPANAPTNGPGGGGQGRSVSVGPSGRRPATTAVTGRAMAALVQAGLVTPPLSSPSNNAWAVGATADKVDSDPLTHVVANRMLPHTAQDGSGTLLPPTPAPNDSKSRGKGGTSSAALQVDVTPPRTVDGSGRGGSTPTHAPGAQPPAPAIDAKAAVRSGGPIPPSPAHSFVSAVSSVSSISGRDDRLDGESIYVSPGLTTGTHTLASRNGAAGGIDASSVTHPHDVSLHLTLPPGPHTGASPMPPSSPVFMEVSARSTLSTTMPTSPTPAASHDAGTRAPAARPGDIDTSPQPPPPRTTNTVVQPHQYLQYGALVSAAAGMAGEVAPFNIHTVDATPSTTAAPLPLPSPFSPGTSRPTSAKGRSVSHARPATTVPATAPVTSPTPTATSWSAHEDERTLQPPSAYVGTAAGSSGGGSGGGNGAPRPPSAQAQRRRSWNAAATTPGTVTATTPSQPVDQGDAYAAAPMEPSAAPEVAEVAGGDERQVRGSDGAWAPRAQSLPPGPDRGQARPSTARTSTAPGTGRSRSSSSRPASSSHRRGSTGQSTPAPGGDTATPFPPRIISATERAGFIYGPSSPPARAAGGDGLDGRVGSGEAGHKPAPPTRAPSRGAPRPASTLRKFRPADVQRNYPMPWKEPPASSRRVVGEVSGVQSVAGRTPPPNVAAVSLMAGADSPVQSALMSMLHRIAGSGGGGGLAGLAQGEGSGVSRPAWPAPVGGVLRGGHHRATSAVHGAKHQGGGGAWGSTPVGPLIIGTPHAPQATQPHASRAGGATSGPMPADSGGGRRPWTAGREQHPAMPGWGYVVQRSGANPPPGTTSGGVHAMYPTMFDGGMMVGVTDGTGGTGSTAEGVTAGISTSGAHTGSASNGGGAGLRLHAGGPGTMHDGVAASPHGLSRPPSSVGGSASGAAMVPQPPSRPRSGPQPPPAAAGPLYGAGTAPGTSGSGPHGRYGTAGHRMLVWPGGPPPPGAGAPGMTIGPHPPGDPGVILASKFGGGSPSPARRLVMAAPPPAMAAVGDVGGAVAGDHVTGTYYAPVRHM